MHPKIEAYANQVQNATARRLLKGSARHVDQVFRARGHEKPRAISLHEAVTIGGFSDEKETLRIPYHALTALNASPQHRGGPETAPRTAAATLANGSLSATINAEVGTLQHVIGVMLTINLPQNVSMNPTITITKNSNEDASATEVATIQANGPVTDAPLFWLFSIARASGVRVYMPAEVRKTLAATQGTALNYTDLTLTVAADVLDVGAKISIYPLWALEVDPIVIASLFTPEDILAMGDSSAVYEDLLAQHLAPTYQTPTVARSSLPGARSFPGAEIAAPDYAGGNPAEVAGITAIEDLPLSGMSAGFRPSIQSPTVRTRY